MNINVSRKLPFSLVAKPIGSVCNLNCWKARVMSYDGVSWNNVGSIGFSNDAAAYVNLALNPLNGEQYVAFQDAGNSNKATVMKYDSLYVGMSDQHQWAVSLYPNPATDKIIVDIPGDAHQSDLSILNIHGQQVLNRKLWDAKTIIDISPFPSGVYHVKITGEKTQLVKKFIKL